MRSASLNRGLDPASQHLGNAPSLCDTAAGCKRLLRVENFADRADAGLPQVMNKACQIPSCAGPVFGMSGQIGVDEGPDEPGPHGPLMVGSITSAQIAEISGFVIR